MRIQTNDISTFYVESGTPNGVPIIFIHGFPFSHEMWKPQLDAFLSGFRAIAYDVRGHGQSDVGDGQFSIEFFVDDLIALMDKLSIPKAILCGLSMGGYIALRTIERFPDRVKGLILADTKSESDGNEARTKRSASLRGVKQDGVAAFAENFAKAIFWSETFSRNPQAIETIKNIIRNNSPLGIGGALLALAARTDTTTFLPSIAIPTLILVGEHDALTPPSASKAMHSAIPGSELAVISNAGHMANVENSEQFDQTMFEFLKKHFS